MQFARITRRNFCAHAHIGDKGRCLWMINYFLACCIKNNQLLFSICAILWPRLALALSPRRDIRLKNLRSRLGLELRPSTHNITFNSFHLKGHGPAQSTLVFATCSHIFIIIFIICLYSKVNHIILFSSHNYSLST